MDERGINLEEIISETEKRPAQKEPAVNISNIGENSTEKSPLLLERSGPEVLKRIVERDESSGAVSSELKRTLGDSSTETKSLRSDLSPEQEKLRKEYISLQQEAAFRIFELKSVERAIDIRYGTSSRKNIDIDKMVRIYESNVKFEKRNFGKTEQQTDAELYYAKDFQKIKQRTVDTLAAVFTNIEKKATRTELKALQIETLEERANRIIEIFHKAFEILSSEGKDVFVWYKNWNERDYMQLRAALEACREYINFIAEGWKVAESNNQINEDLNSTLGRQHLKELIVIQKDITELKKFVDDLDIKNGAAHINRQLDRDSNDPFFKQPFDEGLAQLADPTSDKVPSSMRGLMSIHENLALFENLLNFLQSEYLSGPKEGFEKLNDLATRMRRQSIAWWH
jgi:hypothetical protein